MKERKNMWEIKQAAQNNVLEIYIYGDIESDGYDWWTDEVIRSETSANTFREELAKYADVAEIKLYINSNGGSVFEGTAIYNQLKRHPAKKTVYIDGFACSIASVIAMAGDEIIMPRNALMMIHNMWMCAYGNSVELRKAADDLDIINNAGKQAYLQKAGEKVDEERLTRMMDDETWLNAKKAVELGFADEILFDQKKDEGEQPEAMIYTPVTVTNSLVQKLKPHEPVNKVPAASLENRLALLIH